MIAIQRYRGDEIRQWDQFVDHCRNATFLHKRGYMDYHSHRFQDHSLMAYRNGKLVALLPANEVSDVIYSHQGLTYGSWLVPLKHFDATVMVEVMDAACEYLREQGFKKLVYKPIPHIYHSYPCEEDLYALFRQHAKLIEVNISTTIALGQPLAFDRGNKSGLNVARKAGVIVGKSDDWSAYWVMLNNVLTDRHHAKPVHTLEEILLLYGRFPHHIALYTASFTTNALQGTSQQDSQLPIAGVVMFYTGTCAHCQYIASSPVGYEHKALTLLFDYLIREAKTRGCKYFDFGISNEEHGRVLNGGLVQQKSRLGGRGIAYNVFEIDL